MQTPEQTFACTFWSFVLRLTCPVSFSTAKERDQIDSPNVDQKNCNSHKEQNCEPVYSPNREYSVLQVWNVPDIRHNSAHWTDEAFVWGARKTADKFLTGSVGMFTYHVDDKTKGTLALMWNVPFDFNLHISW